MIKIKVEVSGPGGIINNEVALIERALLLAGAKVNVINEYRDEEIIIFRDSTSIEVDLIADHCPWGG